MLALFPVVRMVGIVLDGSALQHNDYWLMLPRFTGVSGTLDVGGLFEFQNQPVVVAQLLYWLNLKLFAGSNIALGLVVVLLVLGQLTVVALLLRHSRPGAVGAIATFVVASALLFNLTGTWNFAKSMSGAAWLSANLLALVAIYLRSRDRRWSAFAIAVLAALAYSTGLAAWIGVIATGVVRRPLREAWREWPFVVGFAATVLWYRANGGGVSSGWPNPVDVVRQAAVLLGFILGLDGVLGEVVGSIALIAVPVLAVLLASTSRVAGWVGVAVFGLVATLEVSFGRGDFMEELGVQDRYSSLPALTWLGLVALVIIAIRRFDDRGGTTAAIGRSAGRWKPLLPLAVTAPVLLGALTAGGEHAEVMRNLTDDQELREVALRLGVTDGTSYLVGLGIPSTVSDVMRANDHHPFVDGWDLDCGLLDTELELEAEAPVTRGEGALTSGRALFVLPDAVELSGHLSTGSDVRCVVIANQDGVVVGAATIGPDAGGHAVPASTTRFKALARRGADTYRAFVVVDGTAEPLPLDGELTAQQVDAA